MKGLAHDLCPQNHFQAILFRRWVVIKRSILSICLSLLGTLVFSVLAIGLQWLMVALMKPKYKPMTFKIYRNDRPDLLLVGDTTDTLATNIINQLDKMHQSERGKSFIHHTYPTLNDLQEYLFDTHSNSKFPYTSPFGLDFTDVTSSKVNYLYNATTSFDAESSTQLQTYGQVQLGRALWKTEFGDSSDFTMGSMMLLERLSQMIFGQLGPMLIVCGLATIVPTLITGPITDIQGEVRQYMISCTLKILPYWLATFIVDICMWVGLTTLVWAIFNIGQIRAFHDNLFSTWYALVMQGPSFILFVYCFSFLFHSPESASRQAFMIIVLILLIPMIVQMIRQETNPVALDWVYSLIPHISLQQLLSYILTHMGLMKKGFGYFWTYSNSQPYLVMQLVDIIIYGGILILIERNRISLQRKQAKRSFGDYSEFFKQAKAKHQVSEEAHEMEEQVKQSHDWAVRIEDVSRLFINTAGEPISAVNAVSLGVKDGSLFGFLGANGAGKTTLIRMITGMLAPSDGTIEIFGKNIDEIQDRTILSICPQFNTHLCFELTPREHFKLYSMLFQLDPKDTIDNTEKLMQTLELDAFGDKPLRELSGGDVRKLAIALSFLGPAKIVLLDEPTASLDPVACHHVHEMIIENKGTKTFMLCTHLLSEAESLCDMISIMVKGNVYTVGSPQYLTAKFGTEFKIDVMLDDESDDTAAKCDAFFDKELPTAELAILRPKARIYNVPESDITLPVLFEKMQSGAESPETSGFSYYTCSSSSLERVFMEIVHMSEAGEFPSLEPPVPTKTDTNASVNTNGTDGSVSRVTTVSQASNRNVKIESISSSSTSDYSLSDVGPKVELP